VLPFVVYGIFSYFSINSPVVYKIGSFSLFVWLTSCLLFSFKQFSGISELGSFGKPYKSFAYYIQPAGKTVEFCYFNEKQQQQSPIS
jgi:hypothetical protein